jgi:hypothetical protein
MAGEPTQLTRRVFQQNRSEGDIQNSDRVLTQLMDAPMKPVERAS